MAAQSQRARPAAPAGYLHAVAGPLRTIYNQNAAIANLLLVVSSTS